MVMRRCLDCGVRVVNRYRCEECDRQRERARSEVRNRRRPGAARSSTPDRIKKRDGNRCVRCGATDRLQVHHVIPVSAGGSHDDSNLVTLCNNCHREAHGW